MAKNASKFILLFYVILMVLIGIWFFILNQNTPFMHDDLAYHFYYDEHSELIRPTSTPITSFWQIFPSMWHHYCDVNGRFTSHFLIQLFCGLLGKQVFNICNTLVFLLFVDLIVKSVSSKRSPLVLSLVVISVLFLLPFPGQTMLWLSGSINYLWTATFSLYILYFMVQNKVEHPHPLIYMLTFFWGFFVGWMNESITIGVTAGLFVYFIRHRQYFVGVNRSVFYGYALGTMLIVFGPGTFARASGGEIATNLDAVQMVAMRFIVMLQMMISLPVLALGFLAVVLCLSQKRRKYLLMPYTLVFIMIALFVFLIGKDESRIFFGASVLALMLILSLLDNLWKNTPSSWCMALSVISLALCVPKALRAMHEIKQYNLCSTQVESQIVATPESACVIQALSLPPESRFVYATFVDTDRYNFHNRVRAFYYNKDYVQALPEPLYRQYMKTVVTDGMDEIPIISSDTTLINNAYSLPETSLLLLPISKKYVLQNPVRATYSYPVVMEQLNRRQQIIRYLLGTLEKSTERPQKCYYVTKDMQAYLVLPYDSQAKSMVLSMSDEDQKISITIKEK